MLHDWLHNKQVLAYPTLLLALDWLLNRQHKA